MIAVVSCGEPTAAFPPGARPEIAVALREFRDAERHPADGGGKAWLVDPKPALAGRPASWTLIYEAGELGIQVGGSIFFQVSPFWGWSTPQTSTPNRLGYTQVSTTPTRRVEPRTVDQQLLKIVVQEALQPGDRVRIDYGGEIGARSDRYRDRESRFWIGVDGDGDGVRSWVAGRPFAVVEAGSAAAWLVHLPATAQAGDRVPLRVASVDAWGNLAIEPTTRVTLDLPSGLSGPRQVTIQQGTGSEMLTVETEGFYRVEIHGADLDSALSNPMLASEKFPRILWGDLHGHTGLSDGTGTPEDYFWYAQQVAALDFAAITDHDHWGLEPLDGAPQSWQRIRQAVAVAHQPDRFVALLGYEWTSWIYGHRHVVYFADRGPMFSSLNRETEHPQQLWAALTGLPALTFAHHSAGAPIPTDWSITPDPVLEPITEIVSVHGSSEADDDRGLVTGAKPGQFVRDALDRGYNLGFVGSGDSHDGHPGLAHLASPSGGMAAVFSKSNSRADILEALRTRRSYATNGPRILLRARLDGMEMGSEVAGNSAALLRIFAAGTEQLATFEVIVDGAVIAEHPVKSGVFGSWDLTLDTRKISYLYVRVRQRGFGAAWSSPFFIDR